MSMRVLIADPDWVFLQQIRSYLESRGHHTVYEPDTDVVLERAGHWRPDVVMLSAELDDVCDGNLVEKLSALQPRPAILLTAALDSFDKAWRAWQHGGDEMLFKPMLNTSELNVAMFAAMENALCPREATPALTGQAMSA